MLKQLKQRPLRKVEAEDLRRQFERSGAPQRHDEMRKRIDLQVRRRDSLSIALAEIWEFLEEPEAVHLLRRLDDWGYNHCRFRPAATPTERLRALGKRRQAETALALVDAEIKQANKRGDPISVRQAIERAGAVGFFPAPSLDAFRKQVQEVMRDLEHEHSEAASPGVSGQLMIVATVDRRAAREAAEKSAKGEKDIDLSGVLSSVDFVQDTPEIRRLIAQGDAWVIGDEPAIGQCGYSNAELQALVDNGLEAELRMDDFLAERGLKWPEPTKLRHPGADQLRLQADFDKQLFELSQSNCYFSETLRSIHWGQDAHALLREREQEEAGWVPMYAWLRDEEHYAEWKALKDGRRRAPNRGGRRLRLVATEAAHTTASEAGFG